mmetsp:Transcript_5326/g.15516  ORF Transcript_5326/g.15516 Transcript_5326/m.15516 type:complete len:892 (-) Transcript_5326:169-2844(-)
MAFGPSESFAFVSDWTTAARRHASMACIAVLLVILFAFMGERASRAARDRPRAPDEIGTMASELLHRPCQVYRRDLEAGYYSAVTGKAVEGAGRVRVVQTSLGDPSGQWAEVPCLYYKHTVAKSGEGDGIGGGGEGESGSGGWFFSEIFRWPRSASSSNGAGGDRKLNRRHDNAGGIDNVIKEYASPTAEIRVDFASGPAFPHRQPVLGFGGAFTEATALNYKSLSKGGQDAVVELLFGSRGLGYTMGRTHMNSCDFCVASYSFDDAEDDFELDAFDNDVAHDRDCGMIELMKRAHDAAATSWPRDDNPGVKIVASPWSPPTWMKRATWRAGDPANATHSLHMTGSALPTCIRDGTGPDSEYARSWALYFQKFIEAYKKQGVNLYGITPQNEPEFPAPWDACAQSMYTERDFIGYHLGPLLRSHHPDVKLLMFDHNKDHAPRWASTILDKNSVARKYVDGTAVHWYAGGMDRLLDGAVGTPNMHRLLGQLEDGGVPDNHLVLGSEACHCPSTAYAGGDLKVGWARAERYAHAMLADLAAGSNGWIEWNMVLDSMGGPNHLGNMCDAPLLAVPYRAKDAPPSTPTVQPFEKADHPFGKIHGDEWTREELNARGVPAEFLDVGVVVQPLYFYTGHITRHVRPGSRAVRAIADASSVGRTFRRPGASGAGGGINDNARKGMEVTAWPCEGSTRQSWTLNPEGQFRVFGHDWLGNPTSSCLGKKEDDDFDGLLLTECEASEEDGREPFGIYEIKEKEGREGTVNIVLKNGDGGKEVSCIVLQPLRNGGGALGPRGGAQINIGACNAPAAEWSYNAKTGEILSHHFADYGGEVCLTTGWPFLQVGAFQTPTAEEGKAVILLNEAGETANFVLRDGNGKAIVASSIPAHSIQTILFD